MYLTGIPRVLEDAGVEYVLMPDWEYYTAHAGGLVEMRAMFWHTTESQDDTFRYADDDCPTLGFCFGNPGKGYPSYNLLGGRDGTVYVLAGGTSAHAGVGSIGGYPHIPRDDGNRYAIGYSMDANEDGYPPTAAQLEAAARVGAAFDREFLGSIRHIMHGEWAPGRRRDPTQVPGGWSALRSAIGRGYWATQTEKPGSIDLASPIVEKEWSDMATEEEIADLFDARLEHWLTRAELVPWEDYGTGDKKTLTIVEALRWGLAPQTTEKVLVDVLTVQKHVRWEDAETLEAKDFSFADALYYGNSIQWNREIGRDAEAAGTADEADVADDTEKEA